MTRTLRSDSTIREEIRSFILEEIVASRESLTLSHDMDLITTGVLDSLSLMKLANFLETKFHIPVGMEELVPRNFTNLDAIVELVRRDTRKLSRGKGRKKSTRSR